LQLVAQYLFEAFWHANYHFPELGEECFFGEGWFSDAHLGASDFQASFIKYSL
jgi:hypothetical protein